MRLRDRFLLGTTLVGLLLTPTSRVLGQAWLKDRDNGEGTGIRVGDFELHPGIGVLGGYDTNPFYRDEGDRAGVNPDDPGERLDDGVVDAASLRITPHIDFSTLSTKRRQEGDEEVRLPFVDFRGGLSAIITKFFSQGQAEPQVEGRVDLRETFLPERPFSLDMLQEFSRTRIPIQGGQQFNTRVAAGLTPQLSTPGGLLKGRLGYKFAFDDYNDISNNNLAHTVKERLSWEFLPKTALFEELEVGLQEYPNENDTSFATDKNDVVRVTGRAGLNGALTKEIAMTLAGGVTSAWVDQADDSKAPVAQAQLRWRPVPTFRMELDGSLTNQNALQGNTVTRLGGGLKGELTIAGAFVMRAGGKLESMRYGDDLTQRALHTPDTEISEESLYDDNEVLNADARSDLKVTLSASWEYRATSWLAITLEVEYLVNDSNYFFLAPFGENDIYMPNSASYENLRLFGGLRAFL